MSDTDDDLCVEEDFFLRSKDIVEADDEEMADVQGLSISRVGNFHALSCKKQDLSRIINLTLLRSISIGNPTWFTKGQISSTD